MSSVIWFEEGIGHAIYPGSSDAGEKESTFDPERIEDEDLQDLVLSAGFSYYLFLLSSDYNFLLGEMQIQNPLAVLFYDAQEQAPKATQIELWRSILLLARDRGEELRTVYK